MKMSTDNRAGFTLTEVMIASAILVIFVGAFYSAFLMGIHTLDVSVNHYRANAIARNRIQRARSFDYSSIELLHENESPIDHNGNLDPQGTFRRSTTINTNTVTAPYTVLVEVGVRFPIRSSGSLSAPLTMQTLVAVKM